MKYSVNSERDKATKLEIFIQKQIRVRFKRTAEYKTCDTDRFIVSDPC